MGQTAAEILPALPMHANISILKAHSSITGVAMNHPQPGQHDPKLIEAFLYDDYKTMFELDDTLPNTKILDFPGAYSSFNATASKKYEQVTSLDPLYDLDKTMITQLIHHQLNIWQNHIKNTSDDPKKQTIAKEKFERFKTAIQLFLDDFSAGKEQGRYQPWDAEQKLPFKDHSFSLALCSHWLFKQPYSLIQTIEFIDELCRVAGEARIFPLANKQFEIPHYLGHLMANFQSRGYKISCVSIDFDKGEKGGAMLCITSPQCILQRSL